MVLSKDIIIKNGIAQGSILELCLIPNIQAVPELPPQRKKRLFG
jgi:hypothetical protein